MMTFENFIEYLNANSLIILYNLYGQVIGQYDGWEEVPETAYPQLINDIFSDTYITPKEMYLPAIGIELNTYKLEF